MPEFIGWRIWYGDGTTFDSRQGKWEEAPNENVQVIIVYQNYREESGLWHKLIYKGRNYYDFDGKEFYKSDDTRELPKVSIKYGHWIEKSEIIKIIQTALADDGEAWL